jgi:hypothetical protein
MPEDIRRPSAPLLLIVGLLVAACAPAGAQSTTEPILLRWTWTEGETIRLRHTAETESTVTSSMVPEPIATHGTQTTELSQEVTEVSEDGVATVRMVYERFDSRTNGPGGEEMTWSSDDPPPGAEEADEGDAGDPMAELGGLMSSMVGQPITLKLDDRGELLALDGFDELWSRAIGRLDEDDPMAEPLRQTLEGMFSEDTVRQMIGQGMVSFPADPVAPGDTWTRDLSYEMPVIGSFTQHQTYRFERLDGDHAVLGLEGTMETEEDPAAAPLPLPAEVADMLDFQMDIRRGDFEGEIRFDRARGQLDRHELTGELEMTMTMTPKTEEAREMMPEPVVMDIATEFRTLYERIEEH